MVVVAFATASALLSSGGAECLWSVTGVVELLLLFLT